MQQHEKEVFEQNDPVLPELVLPYPCNIRVAIDGDYVNLYIGPRDWSWDRKTGVLLGSGTDVHSKWKWKEHSDERRDD
jgi:hypothetical protein